MRTTIWVCSLLAAAAVAGCGGDDGGGDGGRGGGGGNLSLDTVKSFTAENAKTAGVCEDGEWRASELGLEADPAEGYFCDDTEVMTYADYGNEDSAKQAAEEVGFAERPALQAGSVVMLGPEPTVGEGDEETPSSFIPDLNKSCGCGKVIAGEF